MTQVLIPARIRLHPTVAHGRATGYRSTCIFEGVLALDGAERFGFEMELLDRGRIEPGETARCTLRLWAGDQLPGDLVAGTEIRFLDGASEVGVGEVLETASNASASAGSGS